MFAGPAKPSALAKWAEVAPPGAIGLVAPFPLADRSPPTGTKLWAHDATTGDFRDSPTSRATLAPFAEAADAVAAGQLVFRSPASFSPSATNRDQLRRFFTEIVPAGERPRVWVPGGLWDVRTAMKLATELQVSCAFDPLVREPGQPLEAYFDLEVHEPYLRIESARGGLIRTEQLEDLAALIEYYEDQELPVTVAFASPERWADARNLRKLRE